MTEQPNVLVVEVQDSGSFDDEETLHGAQSGAMCTTPGCNSAWALRSMA